jgi:hypothetical protein
MLHRTIKEAYRRAAAIPNAYSLYKTINEKLQKQIYQKE